MPIISTIEKQSLAHLADEIGTDHSLNKWSLYYGPRQTGRTLLNA